MYYALEVAIIIVVIWIICGLLSLLGVHNAGNVAVHPGPAVGVLAGLYFWLEKEREKADVKA